VCLFEGFWVAFLGCFEGVGVVCWGFSMGSLWPPLYTPYVIRCASRFSLSLIKLLITYQK
jgi:hypothetical protein